MFTNTTNAKFGDLGSEVLKPMPSQATWEAGSEVETMWGLRANQCVCDAYLHAHSSPAPTLRAPLDCIRHSRERVRAQWGRVLVAAMPEDREAH